LERLGQPETDPQRRDVIARDRTTFNGLPTDILAAFARGREQRRTRERSRRQSHTPGAEPSDK